MKFYNGEVITFNTVRYCVQERLGRGAVSDVYLALLDGADEARVVLKVVRDDAADDVSKAEALQREAKVLTLLNQVEDDTWRRLPDASARFHRARETAQRRRIIALLDSGEVAPGHPLVVQEIAPPGLERFDVTTPADERRVFAIAQAVVDVIALAHRAGMSLQDFEPATKGDRLRVHWLDEERRDFTFKMIDWNITGGPEAMAQDLFFFGGHLYYLLTGRHVPLDAEGRPPANLGMGNPAWDALTAGSRQLVAKLLHRDSKRRYQQIEVLAADVAWWNDVLAQIETSGIFRRLDDRLWQARPAGRYDRVLAIADLALRLNPPTDARQSFEQSRKQARDELDKENWQPIAQAQVTMGTRAYEKADQEFAQQLKILPAESEAARLAMIYQRLARVGQLLKQHHQGADERRTPEWEALETRAVKALVDRRWQDAQGALAEVVRLRPESREWAPLKDLRNWIVGGAHYTREVAAAFAEAENRADGMSPEWLDAEGEKIKMHENAIVLLEKVQEQAPFEPEFKERLALERTRWKQRQTFFGHYVQADAGVSQGEDAMQQAREADEKQADYAMAAETYQNALQKFDAALERFEAILREDPMQRRAQLLARRMQTRSEVAVSLRQQALALHEAQQDIRAGRYDAALDKARAVLQLAPGRVQARDMQAEAEVGARLLEQARIYLQGAENDLDSEKFESALKQLRDFADWDERVLRDPVGGQALPGTVGARQPGLRSQASALQSRIEATRDVWDKVQHAEEDDFDEVVRQCESLQTRYPLTLGLRRQYEEARRGVANRLGAAPLITQPESFDDLRKALDILRDDQGRVAQNLRRQAAEKWQVLCQPLAHSDLEQLAPRLREGVQRFPQAETVFSAMLAQAEKAVAVAQRLQSEGEARPYWFGLADWLGQLARLSEDLTALTGSQSWTELRQRAMEWRAALLRHLDEVVHEHLADIQVQSQARQFSAARAALDALWDGIPPTLHDSLPGTVKDAVHSLREALGARLAAEQALGAVLNRLATALDASDRETVYTFQEAAREAVTTALPEHLAVPVDDLAAARADLERAAKMELTAALQPVADLEPGAGRQNYAQIIQTCRTLAETRLDILTASSSLLRARATALQNGLRATARVTARNLQSALKQAVEEQKQHLAAEPFRVLALYYQEWQQTLSLAPISSEMQSALELPKTTLAAAAEQLITLRDLTDFREPELLLARAESLNNELPYLPLDKLPPLPENVHPADVGMEWRIATGSLNAFKVEVAALKKLAQDAAQVKIQTPQAAPEAVPDTLSDKADLAAPTYRYDVGQVSALQTLARDVQQTVKRLRELWQALQLPWDESAPLVRLGQEAALHFTVATTLTEAQRLQTNQAMQGLDLLYRELEEKKEPEKKGLLERLGESDLPLLATPRQALKIDYTALQQELIAALGRQIAGILALPDATEQLQQQILMIPQSRWLADKAYQAISRGVDEQAKQAAAEGRRDTASRLWEIVQDATEPWATESGAVSGNKKPKRAGTPRKPAMLPTTATVTVAPRYKVSQDVGELWAKLHADARENCVALKPPPSRRTLFFVIAASVLVMAAILFSANEFWFKPQEAARIATATAQALALDASAQAAATAMAATATMEAMQGQSALAATAIAQAATATAEAQQGAANLAATAIAQAESNRATATAQAEANMAIAEANRCKDITLYTLKAEAAPQLEPQPGYEWITDKRAPIVYAAWVVTNTSSCTWNSVQLKTLAGETVDVKLFRDGEELGAVNPGTSATVRLYFVPCREPLQGEWILAVNGLDLFGLSRLKYDLGKGPWVVCITPTRTPTPTPTSTPTPTPVPPTPVPTSCPEQCEQCKIDPTCQEGFGVTCPTQPCNCRPVCP